MDPNVQSAAIIMRQYGGPDVLRLEPVSLVSLQPDEIRIRSLASAVNHSDLEIRAGNWPIFKPNPFPYTPGLEVVGEVVEVGANVSDVRVGDRVITMMQGLGGVRPQRPGGYAEYVVVPASAVAAFARNVDPLEMAALGLASVTAFEVLHKIGDLSNRHIAVTGAAGGVGSAAVAIAKAQGAEVIGIISRSEQAEHVRSLGASTTINSQDATTGALGSETIDGVLDTVAGKSFGRYVTALRPGGVVTLTGYASDTLDGAALRRAIGSISGWVSRGLIRAPVRSVFPLGEAAAAHAKLEQHLAQGRVLLVPGH